MEDRHQRDMKDALSAVECDVTSQMIFDVMKNLTSGAPQLLVRVPASKRLKKPAFLGQTSNCCLISVDWLVG